jgi:glucose/arabinose dehydrogenase
MSERCRIEVLESRTLLSSLPPGFSESTAITGLTRPTSLAVLPDGRWLITQQGGQLRVVQNGVLSPTVAASLSVDSQGERGLLGVAADPNFASNHFIYLYYTPTGTTKGNRVVRYTLGDNGAVTSGATQLMQLENLSNATNHNGGAMHFGADGRLYIATGENALPSHAQTLSNRFGKILRINADGSIPTDNPFYNTASGDNRSIWAYGLRNAFTFAVHPTSGRMHINDVGQNTWEEVNLGRAGANYGWPTTEGATNNPAFDSPIYAYNHNNSARAIAGGAFYAGAKQQFPTSYAGDYFFGDYVNGDLRVMDAATNAVTLFGTGLARPVDLDVLPDGSMLYLGFDGTVRKITYAAAAQAPAITQQPQDQTRATGQRATFTVGTSGTAPLSYQWYRNGSAITGATGTTYTTPILATGDNNALFHVVVSNAAGKATSATAKLTVTANTAPTPVINTPAAGGTFYAGQTISYSGSASDTQDGTLAASKLNWTIEYITGGVVRPFDTQIGVASGSFVVPTVTPYTKSDVNFRITLTATDSAGAQTSVVRQLNPVLSTINLSANFSGVPILLDGQPQNTPISISSLQGLQRTLEAPTTFTQNNVTYAFTRWSDNGPRSRTFHVPPGTLNLSATYTASSSGTGQLSGYVINDLNADGAWSRGEAGVAGRTVWLDADNDKILDAGERTQTTASNGKYTFSNLPTGLQIIRQVLPSGWRQTRPAPGNAFTINLGPGQVAGGYDFAATNDGSTPPPTGGTISFSGYVIKDSNADGAWSRGEFGIAGRTVWLDADNDNILDATERRLTTASNGKYVFSDVAAGTYVVRQVLATGWRQTRPAPGNGFVVTLSAGQSRGGLDFGTIG